MGAKRILYVEDNFQNRRLIKKLVNFNGYEFLEAEDGLQGIAIATQEHPDLILMDINLPGIDGMEATTRIKSTSELRDIPIIALTANAMRGDRERIMAAGCDGYLQKPIETVKVIEMIQRFIGPGEDKAQAVNQQPRSPATSKTQTAQLKLPESQTNTA